jgi:peroxiredoxin Q/BCP
MSELNVGDKAPDFRARTTDGSEVSLANFKDKNIVLYFYPKDDTPGCTIEAKEFTQEAARFADAGAVVVGVSFDDAACHQKFIKKYGLKIILLADTDTNVARTYHSNGDGYAKRNTFLIDKKGYIKKIFKNVKPQGHAQEVLAALKE